MNFFLDTSALFKLFVQEELSEEYQAAIQQADTLHVSSLTWVEFHSALRLCLARKVLSSKERDLVLEEFGKDWKNYLKIHINDQVLLLAAELVQRHSLKTLDAIQLASALSVRDGYEEPVAFLTADLQLQAAAQKEKLTTHL